MTQHMVQDAVFGTVDLVVAALRTSCSLAVVGAVLDDAESRRGCALLEESSLAAEAPARLARDRARLFVGDCARPAIAPLVAPPGAAEALSHLREAMAAGGAQVPTRAVDLGDALQMFAALGPARPGEPGVRTAWRHQLVHEHLLAWGARCLSRMQLGAQTFFYQGVANLGLGLLRQVSEDVHVSSAAS